ncbi:hypothetical protein EDD16DRAFT_671564 [Pisolithus croceorrhizus]|nr:hypothetical protein EV401DRAFT_1540268 [Pisolithus croceorrhizus]KAI6132106.1 hypothetical protein EDD16DRAFT_671564 [Pisolithus croceorrhizus]
MMRRTLKKLIRARRLARDKDREVRYRPSDQEFTWLARSTAAIDDFLEACQIDIGKYGSLKASVRTAAKKHLSLGIPPQEQQTERLQVVINAVLHAHPWLSSYERNWPAMLYLHRYLKTRTRMKMFVQKTQPPPYRRKQSSSRLSSPALSNAEALASDRMVTPPPPERPPNIPAPDHGVGKDAVRQFLQLASPSLEVYVDAFIMLGIRDQASLQGFLSWPPNARVQWLNEENGILRMSRLEVGSFLLHCENTARRSVMQG